MMTHRRSRALLALLLSTGLALGACGKSGEENEGDEGAEGPESAEVAAAPTDSAAMADSLRVWEQEAKIAEADARVTALNEVPGGTFVSVELERENGKLIYSYDISVAGKEGIEEVAIDAVTGAMLSHEHESPADEQKEAEEDAGGTGESDS
jgi:uncharacterized membrane protein YkoI